MLKTGYPPTSNPPTRPLECLHRNSQLYAVGVVKVQVQSQVHNIDSEAIALCAYLNTKDVVVVLPNLILAKWTERSNRQIKPPPIKTSIRPFVCVCVCALVYNHSKGRIQGMLGVFLEIISAQTTAKKLTCEF